jgi:hypothetical protein
MRLLLAAVAAASLVVATPLAAEPAATPEQNLDCAAWSAVLGGSAKGAEEKAGVAGMLAWFIGLYEGATGSSIDDALTARIAKLTPQDIKDINVSCATRSIGFGNRLVELGKRISALAE